MKKKIALIGGGFYGCYIANKIKKLVKNCEVHIFEKNSTLMSEAGFNNQYRLHRGFHYPRSKETINQTNKGSSIFFKEFKKFLYFPKENYYIVHKKSKVKLDEYLKTFSKHNISFKKENIKNLKFLKNQKQFEGVINTQEGVILLDKLAPHFRKIIKKNCKIFFNSKVVEINSNRISIKSSKGIKYFNYDLIINSSFTDLNLGLKKPFKVKYELAAMLRCKNFLKKTIGITIVDGPFISVYPCNKNELTISSVKYTPYKKFNNLNNLRKFKLKKNDYKIIKYNIIKDAQKYVDIKEIKKLKFVIAPKVKLIKDKNDVRTTEYKKNKNIISILCGKLDAAPILWNKIKPLVKLKLNN